MIKDRLEMFSDTRDNLDDDFQKYMHNMIKGKDLPNEWASNPKEEEGEHNTGASEFVKDVLDNEREKSDDKEKEDLR